MKVLFTAFILSLFLVQTAIAGGDKVRDKNPNVDEDGFGLPEVACDVAQGGGTEALCAEDVVIEEPEDEIENYF